MNTHQTSAQLKSQAKGILLGKYNIAIMALLLPEVIILLVSLFATAFTDTSTILGTILGYAISFILNLIGGIFTVGQFYIYMKLYCKSDFHIKDVFHGFLTHPDKAIIVQFIPLALSIVCYIPFGIATAGFIVTDSSIAMLLMSLCFIIGSILSVIIQLRYSQVFLLMLDFPDKSALELLSMSKDLMQGHKARLLYINISFIPLILLGLLTFGVGLVFVSPYMVMTYTAFYFNIIRTK